MSNQSHRFLECILHETTIYQIYGPDNNEQRLKSMPVSAIVSKCYMLKHKLAILDKAAENMSQSQQGAEGVVGRWSWGRPDRGVIIESATFFARSSTNILSIWPRVPPLHHFLHATGQS